MNKYGYAVYKQNNYNLPLHIVEIRSTMLVSFAVFNNARDAKNHIQKEKEHLKLYGIDLQYDSDFVNSQKLLNLYQNEKYGYFSNIENRQIYKF